ncbi:MAG: LysR family transcriptional regulator [Archaeoglobaceae archaeon]
MVKLEFMKTFIEVVNTGSLKKAAKNLGVSVSTVSFQIDALESFYGAKLLNRGIRGVELTEEGKIALKNMEMIMKSVEEVKRLITNIKGEKIVLASGMVGLNIVHSLQILLKSRYPTLEVKLELRGAHKCVQGVLNSEYDFAIAGDLLNEHLNDPRLFVEELGNDKLVLITSKEHPLAKKDAISLEEIKNEPMIMLTDDYGITTSTKKALEMSGYSISQFNVAYVVGDYYSKIHAVSSGIGIAITSFLAACRAYEVGLIEMIKISDLKSDRKIYFVASKLAMESGKMREYADFILSKGKQLFKDFTNHCKYFES